MRVTVCELPHEPSALASAWDALREHTMRHATELLLLPECAMVEPLWESQCFDAERWHAAETLSDAWLHRLPQLDVAHVVGTRPTSVRGGTFNQGYHWSRVVGLTPLRSKHYLPNEPGGWEANWFERGEPEFPCFRAGKLSFGLNICTELWALETYGAYAQRGVRAVLSPRATAAATTAKWLSVGIVAAVRSGAYSLSSNRVDPSGTCGGEGWIIGPDGRILARTNARDPFVTLDLDLEIPDAARHSYPRYVFRKSL